VRRLCRRVLVADAPEVDALSSAVLLPLIRVRLATSISMSSSTILLDPENSAYLLVHAGPAVALLHALLSVDATAAVAAWSTALRGSSV
jgi:hypothetical protein